MNSPSSNIYADQTINQADVLNPKLEVINLGKTFTNGSVKKKQGRTNRQLLVLDCINFNIYPNEFACIVVASGCGKSILLNMIAGVMTPSSGTVKINSKELLEPSVDAV